MFFFLGTVDVVGSQKGPLWYNSTTVPGLCWMCGTSSDDLTGHMFGYALAYHLLARTAEEKHLVQAIVDRVVGYIVANKYYYIDITGKPTRWGVWAPEKINRDAFWSSQRGPNAIEITSWLGSAYNLTSRSLYLDQLTTLLFSPSIAYADNIRNTRVTSSWNVNYGDDELSLLSHYILLFTNHFSGPIAEVSRIALKNYWPQVKLAATPFYTFLCALGTQLGNYQSAVSDRELKQAIDTLRKWPLEMIDWPTDNRPRMDYRPNPEAAQDNRVVYGSVDALPSNQRPLIRMNDAAFNLVGGSGYDNQDPGIWLLGYWMARYYNFVV